MIAEYHGKQSSSSSFLPELDCFYQQMKEIKEIFVFFTKNGREYTV